MSSMCGRRPSMARGLNARLSSVRRRVCTGGSELSTVGTSPSGNSRRCCCSAVASWPEAVNELDENVSASRSHALAVLVGGQHPGLDGGAEVHRVVGAQRGVGRVGVGLVRGQERVEDHHRYDRNATPHPRVEWRVEGVT